jgi:hypothetical protein
LVTHSDITLNPVCIHFQDARHGRVPLDDLPLAEASSNLVAGVTTVAMVAFSGPHPVRNSWPAL